MPFSRSRKPLPVSMRRALVASTACWAVSRVSADISSRAVSRLSWSVTDDLGGTDMAAKVGAGRAWVEGSAKAVKIEITTQAPLIPPTVKDADTIGSVLVVYLLQTVREIMINDARTIFLNS